MTLPAQDIVERLRDAMEGVTPGPWQVLSEEHPWTLPANPEFGRPEEKHGNHTERRIYTVAHHPQLKGPYPIVELGVGITNEPGQSVHMVSISPENATYIALCSPDNIGLLLDTISRLTADNEALRKENERLLNAHLPAATTEAILSGQRSMEAAFEQKARADALAQEVERKDAALRRIAEGNLGGASWQANYDKIRIVARAALGDRP